MSESLFIVGLILTVAWLIDRAWNLRQATFNRQESPPSESRAKMPVDSKNKSSQTLRKDWLRLGRRS